MGLARLALIGVVLLLGAAPAAAQTRGVKSLEVAARALRPGQYVWRDLDNSIGAVAVIVSVPLQTVFVYRDERLIGVASVSTGTRRKPTPLGAYTILQKRVFHRSNIYSNAPMPHMQRLTWDGIALHAGYNPGYPASHGCIRLPPAFASLLYNATQVGGAVAVVDDEDGALPPPEPIPLLIADAGAFDGARFTGVTWSVRTPAMSVDDDGWVVPDAYLWLPRQRG